MLSSARSLSLVTVLLSMVCANQCTIALNEQLDFGNSESETTLFIDSDDDDSIDAEEIISNTIQKRAYIRLNEYLTNQVSSDNLEENMKKAIEWMNSNDEEFKQKKFLLTAVKQFTDLNNISGKCNLESYIILLKNDRITHARRMRQQQQQQQLIVSRNIGSERMRQSSLGPMKRVSEIVYKLALEHAKQCQDVYQKKFNERYETMDKDMLFRLETFMNHLIEDRMLFLTSWHFSEYSVYWHQDSNRCRYLFEHLIETTEPINNWVTAYADLKHLAQDDPDRRYLLGTIDSKTGTTIIMEDKFKVLFKKYLIEPCQYFVKELGTDIFVPARYDALLYRDHRDSLKDFNFYMAWARFRLCNRLINLDQAELLSKVISFAASSTKLF